jgi:formate hydrogenlyase transcriptional activator
MATFSPELALPATIVIVEDEFLIANDLRRILTKAGYQVLGLAKSVAEAQVLVEQQPPCIVLIDIFLKGAQTGIDLAHWLIEQRIPFVFLSANLSDSVLEAAKVTRPFGFLNKPFREQDVLTTLEIARYRHAHGEEAALRQQQIQVAVNNAIISIQDREQLCLAIAAQIDKLVPFSFLSLRIGLPEEQSFHWVMLRKTALGTFERIHLPALLGPDVSDEMLEKLLREPPDQLGEQPGIFTGAALEALCAQSLVAQASRTRFGVQSLMVFPVVLKRRSFTNLQLARLEPAGFSTTDYDAVSLIIPQIALALDNLLACEEIEGRRGLKTAELAIASAFQNGQTMSEIAPQVAAAINELLPGVDLLSIYRVGRGVGRRSM